MAVRVGRRGGEQDVVDAGMRRHDEGAGVRGPALGRAGQAF